MEEEDFPFENVFPEIPEEFLCFETGKPFAFCLECQLPLTDEEESSYTITKSIQHGEVLLEWAICKDCSDRFRDEISEESKTAIAEFLSRSKVDAGHFLRSPEEKTSYCFVCAQSRSELSGFTIQAICSGMELINFQAPVLVCHECEEAASEKLSKATRDHYDRFFEDHFGTPPGASIDPSPLKLTF